MAVHAVPETVGLVPVPVRRLYTRYDDVRRLRRAGEHAYERFWWRMGIPPRRLQRRRERRVVRSGRVARMGNARGAADGFSVLLHEIHREPVARFLFQRLPQDSSERRLVWRPGPR